MTVDQPAPIPNHPIPRHSTYPFRVSEARRPSTSLQPRSSGSSSTSSLDQRGYGNRRGRSAYKGYSVHWKRCAQSARVVQMHARDVQVHSRHQHLVAGNTHAQALANARCGDVLINRGEQVHPLLLFRRKVERSKIVERGLN